MLNKRIFSARNIIVLLLSKLYSNIKLSSHGKIRNTRSRLWPKTVIENYEKREDSKLYFSALSFTRR